MQSNQPVHASADYQKRQANTGDRAGRTVFVMLVISVIAVAVIPVMIITIRPAIPLREQQRHCH
jgi:hypothetical protein